MMELLVPVAIAALALCAMSYFGEPASGGEGDVPEPGAPAPPPSEAVPGAQPTPTEVDEGIDGFLTAFPEIRNNAARMEQLNRWHKGNERARTLDAQPAPTEPAPDDRLRRAAYAMGDAWGQLFDREGPETFDRELNAAIGETEPAAENLQLAQVLKRLDAMDEKFATTEEDAETKAADEQLGTEIKQALAGMSDLTADQKKVVEKAAWRSLPIAVGTNPNLEVVDYVQGIVNDHRSFATSTGEQVKGELLEQGRQTVQAGKPTAAEAAVPARPEGLSGKSVDEIVDEAMDPVIAKAGSDIEE